MRPPFFVLPAAALLLLTAAGCVDTPIIGDDLRVVRDSPRYLRAAYVYEGRDAAADADEDYRVGNRRVYGVIGFGAAYPGCAPGVGEHIARRYGATLLEATAGPVETDAQHYYRRLAYEYAANYNLEMTRLLGESALGRRQTAGSVRAGRG